MDQEVSRSSWLGGSLIMMVAAIAVALVIYGLSRTVAADYIDNMSKVLLDKNYSELTELNGSIVPLSKSAIVGLVERNGLTITKVTFIKKNGGSTYLPSADGMRALTSLEVLNELSIAGQLYTYYNTEVNVDLTLGTATITVYIGR